MKIELERYSDGVNRISAYTIGSIVISNKVYNSSLILSSAIIIDDWHPETIYQLNTDDLDQILDLNPELVLLGTGSSLQFPEPEIAGVFHDRNIGLDVMDTAAACRAFNILAAEGREVVAALFMLEK